VHAVLDRHGLVKRRKGRRNRAKGTALSAAVEPNALWCADYKGEFMLADRRYCYPLTITDFASRYLIACEALHSTKEAFAFSVFESAFQEFGLPKARLSVLPRLNAVRMALSLLAAPSSAPTPSSVESAAAVNRRPQ
jgi:transposase InsO family protein